MLIMYINNNKKKLSIYSERLGNLKLIQTPGCKQGSRIASVTLFNLYEGEHETNEKHLNST